MIAGNDKELKLLSKASAEFSKKELAPNREENDKYPFGPFFKDVLEKAFELDFFHVTLPEKYSGIGQGMQALCIILSNICMEDSSLGGIIFTNSASQELLHLADAEDLLKKLAQNSDNVNDFLIATQVCNNPADIENNVNAEVIDGQYILSGQIEYVVSGGIANQALIPVDMGSGAGISLFHIDLTQDGISISEPIHSLGIHACPAVDITLERVQGTLVGKPGKGCHYFEKMTDRMSVAAAAMSWGIMKGSFAEAREYCQGRFQGGRKIIEWSEVKYILAEMAVKLKTAEAIISRTCQAIENGEPEWPLYSRSAALQIQENACNFTTDGIQLLGGVGYMKDFGQEKRFRDAKHIQAFLGLSPMNKLRLLENMIR
jgi:alkylation response protein AidB-like acyl-CoA dehydrogenase